MSADPGPLERLRAIVEKPDTMSQIVQRITDADEPQSLKAIARAWRVPHGKLAQWITEDRERTEQYAAALRIAGEMAALEVVEIADSATPESAFVDKLRIQTRQWYASRLARERFGESTEVKHTGQVSLVALLSGLPRGTPMVDVTPERPALEAPDTVTLPAPAEGRI